MDSELALPRYHVCEFLGKTDNIDFFGRNFEVRISKSKFGFGISTFKIPYIPVFR